MKPSLLFKKTNFRNTNNTIQILDFQIQGEAAVAIGLFAGVLLALLFVLMCCLKMCVYSFNRNNRGYSIVKYKRLFWRKSSNELCPICQDSFKEGEVIVQTFCRHNFHECCLCTWLNQRNSCPLCNGQVRESTERTRLYVHT